MTKKNKEKSNKPKLTEILKNSENIDEDPNVIEFEKQAKIQQKNAEKERENFADIEDGTLIKNDNKKVHKRGKIVSVVACFVLLLAVGVGGNWYLGNSSLGDKIKPILSSDEIKTLGQAEFVDATTQPKVENEYFTKARVDRQTSRDKALEKLQAIIDNTNIDKEQSNNATNEIAKISKYISVENKVETLVCAKGVNNCLAVVSADGQKIDVIVDLQELNEQLIMQIKDVAIEQLGCTFEDVTIIQAK